MTYVVKFRRRRENLTDYRKRLKLLRSNLPRVIVRKSLRNIIVQVAKYEPHGDRIITTTTAFDLKKFGWTYSTKTVPAAYLTGYLAGMKILKHGISKAILDIGRNAPTKGAKVFAVLRGLIDAGVTIPHDVSKLPTQDRIDGKHINPKIKKDLIAIKSKLEV